MTDTPQTPHGPTEEASGPDAARADAPGPSRQEDTTELPRPEQAQPEQSPWAAEGSRFDSPVLGAPVPAGPARATSDTQPLPRPGQAPEPWDARTQQPWGGQPQQGWGGTAQPQQTWGPQPGNQQAWGGTAQPQQAWSGTARTQQSWGGTAQPQQTWGGTAQPQQTWGGTAQPQQGWTGASDPYAGSAPAGTPGSHGSSRPGTPPGAWDDPSATWTGPVGTVDTLGRPERRQRGGAGVVVLAVVLALVAGLIGGLVGGFAAQRSDVAGLVGLDGGDDRGTGTGGDGDGSAAAEGSGSSEPLPQGETGSVAEIAARVLPSVVSIRVSTGGGDGTGSGFVIDADGLILTNNHVIAAGGSEPADDIVVEFANGSQAAAEVVGTEASYDVAVIRIDPADVDEPLVALPWGDSDAVVVGEQVVAVGAPLGLDSTVTTGIVSALNRPVSAGDAQQTAFINAIQTDAAINPGNSGGPLVNMRGEVVGVNSAIAQAPGGQVGGSIGLGFSIPSNQAQRTAGQLVEDGVATFPVIGVLLDRTYQGEGVRIVSEEDATDSAPVVPDGPADQAGLRAGDVILAFEGRPMTESDELVVAIRAREPGDEVTLTVRRGDEVFDVAVVLEAGEQG
jgi:putative serine protease PepD